MAVISSFLSAAHRRLSTALTDMQPYARLMRLDRPIGIWLLLLPGLMAIALAGSPHQLPNINLLLLFTLGAIVMRGAGCAINDVLDRDLDARVTRTKTRPIANGDIAPLHAVLFALALALVGLGIVLHMNRAALWFALGSLPLIALYPLMKRITFWPQAWLGITFNWGVLLGTAAVLGTLTLPSLALYFGCFFWTLGYDTIYAFQDKVDDEKIGVKSTARLLNDKAEFWVAVWYAIAWLLCLAAGVLAAMGPLFYVGMAGAGLQLAWQIKNWKREDAKNCLAMFRSNQIYGLIVFFSMVAGRLL